MMVRIQGNIAKRKRNWRRVTQYSNLKLQLLKSEIKPLIIEIGWLIPLSIISVEYTLIQQGTDIDHCNGQRIQIGDWGKQDPDRKLQKCADTAKASSNCGDSFFFRSDKGRCFCEGKGVTCTREANHLIDEYILGKGKKTNMSAFIQTVFHPY